MPKVSVIVPMFNLRNYIAKCIESLIAQTLTDIEIIIIDDGSTDGCSDIVEHYKSIDSRIILIRKSNGGVSSARNVGIGIACGEYILMVDGDDWLDEFCLEHAYNKAVELRLDAVIFDYYSVSDGVKTYYRDIYICDDMAINGRDYLQNFFMGNDVSPTLCTKLVSASLYKQYGLNPENIKMCEDLATVGKLMYHCQRVGRVNAAYYNYLKRPDSTVHNVTDSHLIDRVKVVELLESFYRDKDKILLASFERYEIIQLIEYLYCHYVDDSTAFFAKSLEKYLSLNKKYENTHSNFNVKICARLLRIIPSSKLFKLVRGIKKLVQV